MDDFEEGCSARNVNAEEASYLAGRDQDRRARSEANHDRMRDEIDQSTHACEPENEFE